MNKIRRETIERLPEWNDDPVARLAHTLAAFDTADGNDFAIRATSGIYDGPTGLTWGDLRELLDRLR